MFEHARYLYLRLWRRHSKDSPSKCVPSNCRWLRKSCNLLEMRFSTCEKLKLRFTRAARQPFDVIQFLFFFSHSALLRLPVTSFDSLSLALFSDADHSDRQGTPYYGCFGKYQQQKTVEHFDSFDSNGMTWRCMHVSHRLYILSTYHSKLSPNTYHVRRTLVNTHEHTSRIAQHTTDDVFFLFSIFFSFFFAWLLAQAPGERRAKKRQCQATWGRTANRARGGEKEGTGAHFY